jgi:hypothetical protein
LLSQSCDRAAFAIKPNQAIVWFIDLPAVIQEHRPTVTAFTRADVERGERNCSSAGRIANLTMKNSTARPHPGRSQSASKGNSSVQYQRKNYGGFGKFTGISA